uniref:Zinc finger and SCAN domain-containing protein 12 n=1 Tax=Toxocara canis TaxID=6265 RepID=A0A183UT35_TOXCA
LDAPKRSSLGQQQGRKRRRGEIANPANTLDGLVARRADDIGASESLIKRYLTENEAIESPSDDQELKRIETDPDVSTRTCSICGYQGKWVSEMIRHKRVHTNERPFKCKYCSRTSKWKADLIRHVAKTHGIRVVSKYSRSKTFDASAAALHELKDNKPQVLQTQPKSIAYTINVKPLPTSVIKSVPAKQIRLTPNEMEVSEPKKKPEHAPVAYRCVLCLFEQVELDKMIDESIIFKESLLVLMSHLRNVHNAAFYECRTCNGSFMDAFTAAAHFDDSSKCLRSALLVNIASVYAPPHEPTPFSLFATSANSATQDVLRKLVISSSTTNPLLPLLGHTQTHSALSAFMHNCELSNSRFTVFDDYTGSGMCDKCPYKGDTGGVLVHKKGHDIPKGLLNYKCAFCDWFAKRKSSIEEHMRVHTNNPQLYMPEVEKNLITPVTLSKYSGGSAAVAVVSPGEHAFGTSLANTSPISANAATPEQVPHMSYPGAFDLSALLAFKQRSDVVSAVRFAYTLNASDQAIATLSLSNLAALSGAIGSRVVTAQSAYSTLSNDVTQKSPASPDNLSLHKRKVKCDFGFTQAPLVASRNSLAAGLNSLCQAERYRTPSPTDSSASSCSPTSRTKSNDGMPVNTGFTSETMQMECFGQPEADRPMSTDMKSSDSSSRGSHYWRWTSENEETVNRKATEEDEIVDVEHVDSNGETTEIA